MLELSAPSRRKTPPPPAAPPAAEMPRRKRSPNGQRGVPSGWRIKPEVIERVREIAKDTGIPMAILVEIAITDLHRRWKEAPEDTIGDPVRRLIHIPVNSRAPADGPPEEGSK